MKTVFSFEGLIGIVFCIVAALGALLAETKRLSILEAQQAAHTASSTRGVSSSVESSLPDGSGHTYSPSAGL